MCFLKDQIGPIRECKCTPVRKFGPIWAENLVRFGNDMSPKGPNWADNLGLLDNTNVHNWDENLS